MKNVNFFILGILLLASIQANNIYGQGTPRIVNTKVDLNKEQQIMVITYDLINALPSDKFVVWLDITNSSSQRFEAKSVVGDIGNDVGGGLSKRIIWDLKGDNANIAESYIVKVRAMPQSKNAIEPKDNQVKKDDKTKVPDKKTVEANYDPIILDNQTKSAGNVNAGKIIVQSIVMPGWGLTTLNDGKPYWIMGIAGYGCIAASLLNNRNAVTNYDKYLITKDITQRESLYKDWDNQNRLSKVAAAGAAGIWVLNLIITAAQLSSDKTTGFNQQPQKFYLGTSVEPMTKTPMVSFHINF